MESSGRIATVWDRKGSYVKEIHCLLHKLCFLYFTVLLVSLFFAGEVQDGVSLLSPGCPGSCFVDHAGLELAKICLPLCPECWD